MTRQEWLDSLKEFEGYPDISLGWPFEHHLDTGHYETLEEVEEDDERDDLGFSHEGCDLCGSNLGGDKYAATALPEDPSKNRDYIPLEICKDCLMFLANGDVPDWLEED